VSFVTPATAKAQRMLLDRFPKLLFGVYNRRRIANSNSWSQHSWPNALDIFFTKYGDTSHKHQARLDKVAHWLRLNANTLQIRTLLWRTAGHWDHIHVDFWPKGYATPSRYRGGEDNLYKTIDGEVLTHADLLALEEDMLQKGDKGLRVVAVQKQLLDLGYELPQWGADGDFGTETEDAVKAFQTDRELEVDGVLRAIDLGLLFRLTVTAHVDVYAREVAEAADSRLNALKEAI